MPNYSTLPNNSRGQRGHILVVEHNPTTSQAACRALEKDRFQTTIFRRGKKDQNSNFNDYDLVLLEHPQHRADSCLKILRRLREFSPVPIVVLSDDQNSSTRILALETGADDYLARPYLCGELVARVKAVLRRSRLSSANCQPKEVLKIDRPSKQVHLRGAVIDLTAREFELLDVLAAEPGRNFKRDEIIERIWGRKYLGDKRRVDLYISRVRSKMHQSGREDLIRSVYGVGYRLELPG